MYVMNGASLALLLSAVVVGPVFSFTPRRIHGNNRRSPPTSTSHQQSSSQTKFDTSALELPLQNALARMNEVMTAEFFLSNPSLKQLHSKCTKNVAVMPSPVAGKGLFASKNIKAGTIVSFYPAHALGMEVDGKQLWVSSSEEDKKYFAQNPPGSSVYLHATDQPIFNRPSLLADVPDLSDAPIYLDINPNKEVDPLWVSQYINDGAIVQSNNEEGVKTYYEQSERAKNCIHLPFGPSPIMATVATRKIKKGEELFTSYGCVYWLGVLYANGGESAPDMTTQIQQQIKESAQDLFGSMKSVATTYASQIEAMQAAYAEL